MNTKLFAPLALAAMLLIGGPAFGHDGRSGDGRAAAFSSGGFRGGSHSSGRSFAFGGSRGYYGGHGGYYGGGYRGYGGGYRGYYGGYGYVYPYYAGYPYYYGYDNYGPAYTVYGSSDAESGGGGPVSVQVQRELAHDGYYRGPIDGIVGPGTSAAISAYQHDNGLRATGAINSRLLDAMGLD